MTLNKHIVNTQTGEETIEPFTAEEVAFYEAQLKHEAEHAAEVAAKEAARKAVFKKLGLTADEIAALLG